MNLVLISIVKLEEATNLPELLSLHLLNLCQMEKSRINSAILRNYSL